MPLSSGPLDGEQFHALRDALYGKIWIVRDDPPAWFVELVQMGYVDATPILTTADERQRCQTRLEAGYDELAAIPRSDYPARHAEARGLLDWAGTCQHQLTGFRYWPSEEGREVLRAWVEVDHLAKHPEWATFRGQGDCHG